MPIAASAIIRRAVDLLQDQASVHWTTGELVRWLNDAQRLIVKVRPDSMSTPATFRCTQGARQSLKSPTATAGATPLVPAPAKLMDVLANVAATSAKKAVRLVSRQSLDAQDPGWQAIAPVVNVANYTFDPRDPLTFYVYPPATALAELSVMYAAMPTDIAEPADGAIYSAVAGNLSLPDLFADDVLNLILYRCYSKDAEFAGNAAIASGYLNLVTASLGAEIAATLAVKPAAQA